MKASPSCGVVERPESASFRSTRYCIGSPLLGWETAIKSEQQARRPVNPNASSHERPGQVCLLYLDGHYLYIQILCSSIRCQVVRLTTALTVHIQIFRFRMFHRRAP